MIKLLSSSHGRPGLAWASQSLIDILEHADELERRFVDHDAVDVRDAAPLQDSVDDRAD